MNFEIRDVEEKKIVSTKKIFASGLSVGKIEEQLSHSEGSRFYTCMDLDLCGFGAGLVQGHGDSPGESIKDAFVSSRRRAEDYLAALEELEAKFT